MNITQKIYRCNIFHVKSIDKAISMIYYYIATIYFKRKGDIMSNTLDTELEKLTEMYKQLPEDARLLILSNANTLLTSEQMRKQQERTA